MPKNVNFIVDCGTYPFDVMFHFGDKNKLPDLLENTATKKEIKGIMAHHTKAGTTHMLKAGAQLIYMPSVPKSCREYGILQHEIFHAVDNVMQKVSIPFENGGRNEAYAYLIGYLSEKVYEKITSLS